MEVHRSFLTPCSLQNSGAWVHFGQLFFFIHPCRILACRFHICDPKPLSWLGSRWVVTQHSCFGCFGDLFDGTLFWWMASSSPRVPHGATDFVWGLGEQMGLFLRMYRIKLRKTISHWRFFLGFIYHRKMFSKATISKAKKVVSL